jgi:hypothetical protein
MTSVPTATQARVFLCHSSEDKSRFVRRLAEDLAARGIDVWFDEWSMKSGDSLRRKIFQEGIQGCTHFLVVLTSRSIDRPWVKEELDAGTVAHIEGRCELMPVVYGRLPHTAVPLNLRSKVYRRFPAAHGPRYAEQVDRLIEDIGAKTVVHRLHGGPDFQVPMGGLTLFAAVQQRESERWKDPLLMTQIDVGLCGLLLTEPMDSGGRIVTQASALFDEAPTLDNWRSASGAGVTLRMSGITGDPLRNDPLRVVESVVTNYGRGPMERVRGGVRFFDLEDLPPREPVKVALHLGTVWIEDLIDDPPSASASGVLLVEPGDLRDIGDLIRRLLDPAVLRLGSVNLCWQFRYQGTFGALRDYAIVWHGESDVLTFEEWEGGRWGTAASYRLGIRSGRSSDAP